MKLLNNLYFYPEKGMMDCNTYVIKDELTILIDPGLTQSLPALLQDLHKDGIEPKDIDIITNTHLHGDHCLANEALKKVSEAKIILHPLHKRFYDVTVVETAKYFGFQSSGLQVGEFKADDYLNNNKLGAGSMEFELIHSPGHSPDSICFYCPKEKILICGDVVFIQNTGRVDLPGGNADELKRSIEALSQLEIEYLLPGHMYFVAGAKEVKSNFEYIKQTVIRWL